MNKQLVRLGMAMAVGFGLALAGTTAWAAQKSSPQITRDEFFIVSEVSLKKHEVVMEEPTQITITMNLTGKTAFTNQQGHALPIADMRAGDTVYVTYEQDSKGVVTALAIREGPMTRQELRRRYF